MDPLLFFVLPASVMMILSNLLDFNRNKWHDSVGNCQSIAGFMSQDILPKGVDDEIYDGKSYQVAENW